MQSLCCLMGSAHVTFLQCVHQPGSSTELQHSDFLLEFHYLGMIESLAVTELNLQSQLSVNLVDLSGE